MPKRGLGKMADTATGSASKWHLGKGDSRSCHGNLFQYRVLGLHLQLGYTWKSGGTWKYYGLLLIAVQMSSVVDQCFSMVVQIPGVKKRTRAVSMVRLFDLYPVANTHCAELLLDLLWVCVTAYFIPCSQCAVLRTQCPMVWGLLFCFLSCHIVAFCASSFFFPNQVQFTSCWNFRGFAMASEWWVQNVLLVTTLILKTCFCLH